MKEKLTDKQIMYFCAIHSHRSSSAITDKHAPSLTKTKVFLDSLPEEVTEKIVIKVAEYIKVNPRNFIKKFDMWKETYAQNKWCRQCGTKPVKEGNRLFCTDCYKKASNKSTFDAVGGNVNGGFRVNHSGGSRKIA